MGEDRSILGETTVVQVGIPGPGPAPGRSSAVEQPRHLGRYRGVRHAVRMDTDGWYFVAGESSPSGPFPSAALAETACRERIDRVLDEPA